MGAAAPPAPDDQLIVFVLLDATRADHLGAYGYGRPTTPTIDRLAQAGMRFTQVYCNAPWTRPSTASFLTGVLPAQHRTQTETSKLPADVPTLAEALHDAGWQTAAFVANGHVGSLAGLDRGFDLMEDPTRTYVRGARGKPYLNGLPTGPFIVDRALRYLADHPAPKQFLFLFLVDAHDPYEAPPALEKQFLGDFHGTVRRRAAWEYNNDYPAQERFSMMAVYDAGIRAADAALGTLQQGLAQQNPKRKVTWVVSADHGEGMGEHHFYLHAYHYWDEVVRIPAVISGPHIKAGVDDRLAQSIDVTATIASLAGVAAPTRERLPGRTLLGPAPKQPHIISEYNEYGVHRQAIISERYKAVWQTPADEAWYMRTIKDKKLLPSVVWDHEVVQVFDRARDPKELHPLAQPYPAEALALLAELQRTARP